MTEFRVWAPLAEQRVELDLSGAVLPMHRDAGGWWALDVPQAGHGTDYAFRVDGGDPTPDPRSRWQPGGVHAASRVYDDSRFTWADDDWAGRDVRGGVVYELHVGTFTPEGTFDAAAERLDHLVDLGVDTVELMPVAAFPGRHGWGYDGVDLWAVHEPYGGPDGLKRLVDACHRRGIAVVLDVVYNHLGPSGNYLGRFGPYFTETHHTPWGAAVNLDDAGSDEVRRWIVDNAVMWLRDHHLDGLRLDAVHALRDDRAQHLLQQLSARVDRLAAELGRPLTLIAESDRNDPRTVTPLADNGFGLQAQWDDDVHHALHALLTGERQGYYCDFGSLAALAKVLTGGFFHDGTWSTFRGRSHGAPLDRRTTPGHRLVAFLQDHDQVGNRAVGDRLSATLSPGLLRVGAGLLLTSPFTPMLFMGEEWGASTPWQYFTDHSEPELAEAIRRGRRAEFAEHGWAAEDVPDPQDPATFERSRLHWAEAGWEPHAALLDWYRMLIRLRRHVPDLADPRLDRTEVSYDEAARWLVVRRGSHRVVANLSPTSAVVPLPAPVAELVAASDDAEASGDTVTLAGESLAVLRLDARS